MHCLPGLEEATDCWGVKNSTGGGDGVMNPRRSLQPTVFTTSPCLWVWRVAEMDAERRQVLQIRVSAWSSSILEKGGGGEVGRGGFLHTAQCTGKRLQNPCVHRTISTALGCMHNKRPHTCLRRAKGRPAKKSSSKGPRPVCS
jgi:hypothetical protein